MSGSGSPQAPVASSTHLKQWKAYAGGTRSPRRRLIEAAEAAVSPRGTGKGSMADHDLLLWDVLREPPLSQKQWLRVMARLNPAVRSIAAGAPCLVDGRGAVHGVPDLGSRELRELRMRPSFDCLALLCSVVYQANHSGAAELASRVGRQLVNSFWQMALQFRRIGIAKEVLAYVERWVLPHTRSGGLRMSFGPDIERQLVLLEWEATVRHHRRPRETQQEAAAKVARAAARRQPFDARSYQYDGRYGVVENARLTAEEFAEVWYERAIDELLRRSTDAWGPVMVGLFRLRVDVAHVLVGRSRGDVALDELRRSHHADAPDAHWMRLLCPRAMAVIDRLNTLVEAAPLTQAPGSELDS